MANQVLIIFGFPGGGSITGDLYSYALGAAVESGLTFTEDADVDGTYKCTVVGTYAGYFSLLDANGTTWHFKLANASSNYRGLLFALDTLEAVLNASAVASVTGNIGGVAANGITATSIATDAFGADEISAAAVTKIQAGLATTANVSAVETDTQDIQARLPAALTAGGNMKADALALSGDTVAADNAEAFFDGTGYAGTGNVIPNVTLVATTTNLTNAPTNGDLTAAMTATVNAQVDTALADIGLTVTRTGYLDNLSAGAVAQQSSVNAIQNNTRTVIVVPDVIEIPDSGTTTYLVHLYLYDETGNMEVPDSAPTVTLANAAGTDRSSRLDSTTGTLVGTGHYKWTYTNTSTDALEQLLWEFSVVESAATRLFGRQSLIVDSTAVDFTAADRTKLSAVFDKLPTNNIADETNAAAAAANSATAATQATQANTKAGDIQTRIPAALTVDGNIKADALKLNGATPNNLAAGAAMTLTAAYDAAKTAATQASVTALGTPMQSGAEVVLSSVGLDQIPTTAPTGVASTFREMLVQTWRRFFKKATKTSSEIKTYADNETTVLTTQAISKVGDDETQGSAA